MSSTLEPAQMPTFESDQQALKKEQLTKQDQDKNLTEFEKYFFNIPSALPINI